MNDQKLHRLFIGCDVTEEFRTQIGIVIEQLKKKLAKKYALHWALLHKIHFTLRFLGYIPEEKITIINQFVKHELQKHREFELRLKNIDFFPKTNPHVLAINVQLTENLARLYADLNRALSTCEIEKDNRIFLPHITLARFRGEKIDNEVFDKEFALLPQSMKVDKIYLYESNQLNREEEYKKLEVFTLTSSC